MSDDSPIHPGVQARNLGDLYGLPLLDWVRIESRLEQGVTQAPGTGGPDRHTCWLATINRDGSPHITGVGALWVDGTFWFETGESTRKAKNIARDARCTLSIATREFDLVVDGKARRVTDPPTVAAMAERWAAQGWPARVPHARLRGTGRSGKPRSMGRANPSSVAYVLGAARGRRRIT